MVKVNSKVEGGRELHSFQGTSFYGNIQVEEVKPKRIKILLITCTIWSEFKSFIFLKGLHCTVTYKQKKLYKLKKLSIEDSLKKFIACFVWSEFTWLLMHERGRLRERQRGLYAIYYGWHFLLMYHVQDLVIKLWEKYTYLLLLDLMKN